MPADESTRKLASDALCNWAVRTAIACLRPDMLPPLMPSRDSTTESARRTAPPECSNEKIRRGERITGHPSTIRAIGDQLLQWACFRSVRRRAQTRIHTGRAHVLYSARGLSPRSEEHTSELQSR